MNRRGEISKPPAPSRRRGDHWVEIKGNRIEAASVKDVLFIGLKALESAMPGTREKLSHIKLRTKRIVAHEPQLLFDSKHLVKEHSEKLLNGWWVGTNNSGEETANWLQRAVSCAGLDWGKDFRTSLR